MIVTKSKFTVHKNGKDGRWRKGYIALSVEECDKLLWEPKEVVVIIAEPGEKLNIADVEDKLARYQRTLAMEAEIKKMREEIE